MLRKILRKLQPNFQHYVKKIEAQAKKVVFLLKKKRVVQSVIFSVIKSTGGRGVRRAGRGYIDANFFPLH